MGPSKSRNGQNRKSQRKTKQATLPEPTQFGGGAQEKQLKARHGTVYALKGRYRDDLEDDDEEDMIDDDDEARPDYHYEGEEDEEVEGDEECLATLRRRLRQEQETCVRQQMKNEELKKANAMLLARDRHRQQNEKKRGVENPDGDFVARILTKQQESSLSNFVKSTLFPQVKAVSNQILRDCPWILKDCYKCLGIVNVNEQGEMRANLISKMRRDLCDRRKYVKSRLKDVYLGE